MYKGPGASSGGTGLTGELTEAGLPGGRLEGQGQGLVGERSKARRAGWQGLVSHLCIQ